jgi:membrane protein DedA with SNARE-associated domain
MAPIAETADIVRDLLSQYGLVILFGIFILEGAMLLYFAPSESLVPTAVLWAKETTTSSQFFGELALIIGVSVVGATIGQFLLFTLAKRGGREYIIEHKYIRVSEDTLDRFDGWFDRWGPIAVPVTNTLLFTRGMLTIPAGLAEMDDKKFVALSALGTLSFETILAGLALGVLQFL